jgi:hypothetical protein
LTIDPAKIAPGPARAVEIDGIGTVMIRRPRLADVLSANSNPYWWTSCCTCPDGSPLFAPGTDIGSIDAEIAGALIAEVNATRPTQPPRGGTGA